MSGHPAPKNIAVAHCTVCGRVRLAHYVNAEDCIPARYCSRCGAQLRVVIYRYERAVGEASL